MEEQFTLLMNKYLHAKAKYGSDAKYVKMDCEQRWRVFCSRHNDNRKNSLRADPEAFKRQLDADKTIDGSITKQYLLDRESRMFEDWVKKMQQYYPKRMWSIRLINRLMKKDYVKARWEKLQGKSPRGAWI